jgi:uncharacterized protein YaiE (UPF0345 family)
MAIRKIISRSIGVDVIAAEDLAAGSVETAEIQNGAVTGPKLADNLNYDSGTLYLDSTNNRVGIGTTSPTNERMRIDSSGNIGIGTSSPTSKLSVVSGTNAGITVNDGTVNTILFNTSSANGSLGTTTNHPMAFYTNNAERMRIDSIGRLLVGATVHSVSSSQRFEVQGGVSLFQVNSSSVAPILVKNTDQTAAPGSPQIIIQDGGGNRGAIYRDSSNRLGIHGQGGITFHSGSTAPTTERMRIDSGGNVYFNQFSTSSPGLSNTTQGAVISDTGRLFSSVNGAWSLFNRNVDNGGVIQFARSGTVVGSIEVTLSSTSYNTSSDYRLKENVEYDFDASTRLKQLKPARFNFITDADTTVDGFLAHEVQDIIPEAISGTKDAVENIGTITDQDNNVIEENVTEPSELPEGQTWTQTGTQPVYQGIDQAKLVPLLVKSLQEALTEIDSLKARLDDAGL